jgi:hypothetical protein
VAGADVADVQLSADAPARADLPDDALLHRTASP